MFFNFPSLRQMTDDTPLAIACGVIAIISLAIQVVSWAQRRHLSAPSPQILAFANGDEALGYVSAIQSGADLILLGLTASLVSDTVNHGGDLPLPSVVAYAVVPVVFSPLTLVSYLLTWGDATFRSPFPHLAPEHPEHYPDALRGDRAAVDPRCTVVRGVGRFI